MNNILLSTILIDKFKGENVKLTRITMINAESYFDFKRLQFLVNLAFDMIIKKAKGGSIKICELNLQNKCFSNGQLYVAYTLVGKPSALHIYAREDRVINIVYQMVLE